jgi:hypothetical protein
VLEAAQVAALGNVNATIRDRYYGAATATPTSVFPLLMKNYKNHLKSVRTKKGERLGNWYEKRVGEIVDGLAGVFRAVCRLRIRGVSPSATTTSARPSTARKIPTPPMSWRMPTRPTLQKMRNER